MSSLKQILLVVILFSLAFLAFKFYKTPNFGNGTIAADFVGYQSNGDSLRLSDFRGSIVILDFWGSWCAPCRQKNQDLVALYQQYSQRRFKTAKNFQIISVGIETNPKAWLAAIEKDGLNWPHHISDFKRFDDHVALLYKVREIPNIYLIDENGMVIGRNMTLKQSQEALEKRAE
jgi:thiol-disulfide isomerase/thioredoxin